MINKKFKYYALEFELDDNNYLIPVGFFSRYCEFDGNNELREIAFANPDFFEKYWKLKKINYSVLNTQAEYDRYVNSGAKGKILITEELIKTNVGWLISFPFSVHNDANWAKVSDRDKSICLEYATTQRKITAAKLAERDKIMSNLSHDIKNLIYTSVTSPLEWLLEESEELKDSHVISNALRGADLVRRIVNAMSSSSSGSFDDFVDDATHNDSGSETLQSIVYNALLLSIGNLFDGRNFGTFQEGFFSDQETLQTAKMKFEKLESNNFSKLSKFCNQFLFDAVFEVEGMENFIISDNKGSATKLLILFQEVIFNAVKYSGFVNRKQRYLNIKIKLKGESFDIDISNSTDPAVRTRSSGLGHIIIEKMTGLMKAKYHPIQEDDSYCVKMGIPNFWKLEEVKKRQVIYLQDEDFKYSKVSEKKAEYKTNK